MDKTDFVNSEDALDDDDPDTTNTGVRTPNANHHAEIELLTNSQEEPKSKITPRRSYMTAVSNSELNMNPMSPNEVSK